MDESVRQAKLMDRTLSCHVSDLGITYLTRLGPHGADPIKELADGHPAAQIRFTAKSDDVLTIADDPGSFARAWLSGRLKVEGNFFDLLHLRRLLLPASGDPFRRTPVAWRHERVVRAAADGDRAGGRPSARLAVRGGAAATWSPPAGQWALPPAGLRHTAMPSGGTMSVQTVCLGWHWLPYRYTRTAEDVDGAPVKPFPGWLADLGRRAVADAYGDPVEAAAYQPDVALINFYDGQARMGMHADKDERSRGTGGVAEPRRPPACSGSATPVPAASRGATSRSSPGTCSCSAARRGSPITESPGRSRARTGQRSGWRPDG